MPFMRGAVPLKRTLFHLRQGKISFRDDVAVFMLGYHRSSVNPQQRGAQEFEYWHWDQLQYRNPNVQLVKREGMQNIPYALAFLNSGREVLIDLEYLTKDEVVDTIQGTLGKTATVLKREHIEKMLEHNTANFGEKSARQCICEVQGQRACTSLLPAPDFMTGKWRWNHHCK